MKRGASVDLRPCPRNGASWRAGVGRVRRLAFLSILHDGVLSLGASQNPLFEAGQIE